MTSRQDGSSNDTMDNNDLTPLTAPQPALPSLDIMSHETRDTYLKFGVPLFQAALKGDWNIAEGILEVFPDAVRARITNGGRTILHIAAIAKRTKFVIELVRKMNDEDLALQTEYGGTALCHAAVSGQVEIAKVMVERNPNLMMIRNQDGLFPLSFATLLGRKDMTWYLYRATNENDLTLNDRIELLVNMINTELYDVALDMLQNHMELATARAQNGETALHAFARKPLKASTFDNQSQKGVWWRRCTKFFSGVDIDNVEICMHPKALELVKCLWERMILSDNIPELIGNPWGILFVAAELFVLAN